MIEGETRSIRSDRSHGEPRLSARQNAQLQEHYKRALAAANLTETELANRVGVVRHTLSDFGKTPSGPRLATLLAVARELGLYSLDELLGKSATQNVIAMTDD